MTDATQMKDESAPSSVRSSKADSADAKGSAGDATPVPSAVPSAGLTKAATTPKAAASSPLRRAAPPSQAPVSAAITGSSRSTKSKKKKGSGGGAGSGENTGRWTAEEHRLFLQGLEQHGKGWKKIASLIKSRTVVQIRTHAQKYFQKLAKARQNGEEGDVSMEGRGGISTITSPSTLAGGLSPKRRRQPTGTKRKAIHSVVASAQREGKKQATEQGKAGEPAPPALPAVSPVLAHFVLPEAIDSGTSTTKSSLGSSTTTSQGTVSGPALEDSIFRFLTPTPVTGQEPALSDVARQAGAQPITLPSSDQAGGAAIGGEISPTGVADLSLYPSWTDGKDPPSWYAKGADVEALLDVADTLDWLADPGDPNETYQPPASEESSENPAEVGSDSVPAIKEEEKTETIPVTTSGVDVDTMVEELPGVDDGIELPGVEEAIVLPEVGENMELPEVEENEVSYDQLPKEEAVGDVEQQLPSIFDGAPESSVHLNEEKQTIPTTESTAQLVESASHPTIEEPLFDTPMEEHDFVSTILENESTADLPALD